eukprot:bmy_15141T0
MCHSHREHSLKNDRNKGKQSLNYGLKESCCSLQLYKVTRASTNRCQCTLDTRCRKDSAFILRNLLK